MLVSEKRKENMTSVIVNMLDAVLLGPFCSGAKGRPRTLPYCFPLLELGGWASQGLSCLFHYLLLLSWGGGALPPRLLLQCLPPPRLSL